MSEEITLWILGLGPVIVNNQFVKDIGRRQVNWYLNGHCIPKEPRKALQRVYEDCGDKYYLFTKYINQTLGNMMYEHIKRMYWQHGHICQVSNSYVISAISNNGNIIKAKIQFDLYDWQFKRSNNIGVLCKYDIDKNETTIKVIANI